MNYDEFIETLNSDSCPSHLDPCLQALWHDASNNWDTAHEIVQPINTDTAAHVHAYLHRKEGDDWNARYWYQRAGAAFPDTTSLEQEWASLVSSLLPDMT